LRSNTAVKLTRLTHKIAIQMHLAAESCTICSSHSRLSVRKLMVTLSYVCSSLSLFANVKMSLRTICTIW
jgi:hypothetical protein